jgi:nicotinic acid phosphoribosyltransferase
VHAALQKEELAFVRALRFMKPDYIEFLRLFQLNREFIQVRTEGERLSSRPRARSCT